MWKFKDLYENVYKAIKEKTDPVNYWKERELNFISRKPTEEPEFKWPIHHSIMTDEYGDIDIPKRVDRLSPISDRLSPISFGSSSASTYSNQSSAEIDIDDIKEIDKAIKRLQELREGEPGIYNIFTQCTKHGDNTVFYDTRFHKECPLCKEEREKLGDFLSESDMQL